MGYKNLTDQATHIYVQTGMDNTRGDAECSAMKTLTEQDYTTHNCYGSGASEDCGKYWNNGNRLTPINQTK